MVINGVFKINFPFFKILFAIAIIWFGFKILFGSFGGNSSSNAEGELNAVFSWQRFKPTNISEDQEYNAVFSNLVVDLREAGFNSTDIDMEVNAVFGKTVVYLPKNVKTKVKASAVFGAAVTPDGNQATFGDSKYLSEGEGDISVTIEANAVFGRVELIQ